MLKSILSNRITLFLFLTSIFLGLDNSVQAKIIVEGNAQEKQEIRQAINLIKQQSAKAKQLFDELESRKERVTIRFDNNAKDTARAFIKGSGEAKKNEVVLNKSRIDKFKQINNAQGGGKALEQFDLKYIIAHEALGHILNALKFGVPHVKKYDEDAAVATVNMIQVEAKSVERTAYTKITGQGKDKKLTVPFADGSSVDVTDAYNMGTEETKGQKLFEVIQEGTLNLKADLDNSNPDTINLSLNPLANSSTFDIFLPNELGSAVQTVNVLDFKATLTHATEITVGLNLVVTDFELLFSSFNLEGNPTGINKLELVNPWQTPIGTWDYSNSLTNFSFNFSGEFLLSNSLVSNDIAFENIAGSMINSGDSWTSIGNLEGIKFTRPNSVPEPSLLFGLLSIGILRIFDKKKLNNF
jgi:hypothetical protein